MNIELNNFDKLESRVLELVRLLSSLKRENCEMEYKISNLEKKIEEIEGENKRLRSQRERLCSKIEDMLENIETVTGECC